MNKKVALASTAIFLAGSATAQVLQMTVGEKSYRFELNGNDAAVSFAMQMPLKLKFEDYGRIERISYLPKELSLGNSPRASDPKKGDISYYAPWGNLAVFVQDFQYSDNLIPLGKLPDDALEALQNCGSSPVEFQVVKSGENK